jgi:hypothetical protein
MEDAFRYYVLAYEDAPEAAYQARAWRDHRHHRRRRGSRARRSTRQGVPRWTGSTSTSSTGGIRNRRRPGWVDLLDPRRLIRRDFLSIARRLTKRGQGGLPGFVADHGH